MKYHTRHLTNPLEVRYDMAHSGAVHYQPPTRSLLCRIVALCRSRATADRDEV
jgi:hypothetical protein